MDDVTAAKMNFRKEQWKQFILDRQASGLTINNWCQQHGFKRTTYFYWLRRIRKEACQTVPEPQATTPVPFVQIGSETVPSTVSNPLTEPKAVSPETAIHIRLKVADITIADGTSPQTIRATLLALKNHVR